MANIKEFTIKINGIQESVDAIEALSNKLNALDLQINKERKIDVEVTMPQTPSQQTNGTTTSSSGGRNNSGLSEEAKLQNQIIQNAEKITAARTNDYQVLLRQKETLKDINVQQKANVAETALQTKEYANTMQGLKQELADIKQVMQTTDLADDKFKDLVGRAGQLTEKLKQIEQSYGTWSRDVGHYSAAAEGFKNFSIEVAGATQEFNSAKQALMELKKEMQTLSAKKDMGLISDEEAERLKSLIPVVKELESSIKDAGKPMDALMDTMQSVVAIAQAGKGLSALFGFDNGKIEESIQKLVALQNVMQSLQTIQKQMQTGEGIGGWLTKGNAAIDAMTKKMLGATKAAKGLSLAIKGIGIGAVVGAVMLLVDAFNDMEEAEKKAEEEAEKLKKKIEEQRQSFVNASAQYNNTASRISHLRSEYIKTNDQLKKTSILKEASNEFKKLGISINSVSDAQRVLVEQGNDVIELLKLQGNAAALSAMRMEAYKKSFNMLLENGYDVSMASTLASYNSMVVQFDSEMDKINAKTTELQKKLKIGDFSNKVKENSDKTQDAVKKAQENINELTLKLMSDGLYKELKRLDENNRKEIDKIKQNGEKVEEQLKLQNKVYEKEQKNRWVWQIGFSEAGNIFYGIYELCGVKGEKKIFGNPFSQFVKLTNEIKYYHYFTKKMCIASRLYVGAGYAYGNSQELPYSEQFYIGGANSLRAFTIRSIGPGSYRPDASNENGFFDQTGNFKLEANIEFRFPIWGDLEGAAFVDAGNIWLLKEDALRPGGELSLKSFARDIALGTGLGLRYDVANYLVVRIDVGVPIHAPYATSRTSYYNIEGSFWKNLRLHLAIGYPF